MAKQSLEIDIHFDMQCNMNNMKNITPVFSVFSTASAHKQVLNCPAA